MDDDDTTSVFLVVRNHEEQFSIWREDQPMPAGWEATGFKADKASCLAHIAEVWTDMRPKSLREKLMAQSQA